MTNRQEEIVNKIEIMLSEGKTSGEIISTYPEAKGILQTISFLEQLPKKTAPRPAMQRKYILAASKSAWFGWVHISRFVVASSSAILLISLALGTGYAASKSMPGETLFSIKKTAEHLQVSLTPNAEDKISLQVEIAKKRLSDAQTIFNSGEANPEKESAVMQELAMETQKSVDALSQAAREEKPSLTVDKNHPLMASLESITTKQQELLTDFESKPMLNEAAKNVIESTKNSASKVAEIKRYLEAASNEQALAKLSPTIINSTSSAAQIKDNKISASSTQDTASSTEANSKNILPPLEILPEDETANTAIGGFIIEDPAPQTDFKN
jgi:hypothetical protein